MEAIGVRVEIATLSPTVSLSDALDSAAQRGLLYCVIITSQHEIHRSVTLTILHGRNPQGKFPLSHGLVFLRCKFIKHSLVPGPSRVFQCTQGKAWTIIIM